MNIEPDGLKPLYAYARALEPTNAEIRHALVRWQRDASRARRRKRAAALCAIALLLLGTASAIAGVGPLGQITRPQAVSVVQRVDQMNAAIEGCMVANGATVTVTGSEHAFTDPGHQAQNACAALIKIETDYTRGDAYQAFAADQAARVEPYAACMKAAGHPVPGWFGLSGNTQVDTTSTAYQAAANTCSDTAGLIRRTPNGTGIAPATTP